LGWAGGRGVVVVVMVVEENRKEEEREGVIETRGGYTLR